MNPKKKYALDIIADLISDYLYYDLKEDENLSREEMEELIESGELTVDEIIERFSIELRKAIEENYEMPSM